jgi:hypothetical protein
MGIGLVVPAIKILEILNRPELKAHRDESNARALTNGGKTIPTMDITS